MKKRFLFTFTVSSKIRRLSREGITDSEAKENVLMWDEKETLIHVGRDNTTENKSKQFCALLPTNVLEMLSSSQSKAC